MKLKHFDRLYQLIKLNTSRWSMRFRMKWFWVWPIARFNLKESSTAKDSATWGHWGRHRIPWFPWGAYIANWVIFYNPSLLKHMNGWCLFSRNLPSFKISIEAQAKDIVSSQYQHWVEIIWVERDHPFQLESRSLTMCPAQARAPCWKPSPTGVADDIFASTFQSNTNWESFVPDGKSKSRM